MVFAPSSFQTFGSQLMSVFNTLVADSNVSSLIATNSKSVLVGIELKPLGALTYGGGFGVQLATMQRFCLET